MMSPQKYGRTSLPSRRGPGGIPLFHLYGDPPDDQAFDFIHSETITSRSSMHDWMIGTHRHRNLFQILVVERAGGEMTYEVNRVPFKAPAAILVPATVAHGFRFDPDDISGWVVSFSEDVVAGLGDSPGATLKWLKSIAAEPVVPLHEGEEKRLSRLCLELYDESCFAREGYRVVMRGLLAQIAVETGRLGAKRARAANIPPMPGDATTDAFRKLVEDDFRAQRCLNFYTEKLGMTADRLNDHIKRATGVTAGHLIRQRILIEAKRQLVFTAQSIHAISDDLGFCDPSHFVRFFRRLAGVTPQEFRKRQAG